MKLIIFSFLIVFISSCTQKEQNKVQIKSYFDLKGYFEKEADRLNKTKSKINKSVAINGETEHKIVKIEDYKAELSSFISSDINKASWKGAFNIQKKGNSTIFSTSNEKIPIKKLEVQYVNNKIRFIQILIETDNILYHSIDSLTYFPDSLYEIKKIQKIKLLKEKKYVVVGKFTSNSLPEPLHNQSNQ